MEKIKWMFLHLHHIEVITLQCYVMQFKGDWKYLVQLFNFTNTASKEKARPSFECVALHPLEPDVRKLFVKNFVNSILVYLPTYV